MASNGTSSPAVTPTNHSYRSKEERLISAARTDNDELLLEVLAAGNFDINYQDGFVQPSPANEMS